MKDEIFINGLGQDSHRFEEEKSKPLIIGGVEIDFYKSLKGNSDADPVLHAITNAISSVTGKNILGSYADKLCREEGITDSAVYLKHALKFMDGLEILHVAISIECLMPKISPEIDRMKKGIARLLGISPLQVGITATTGEGLTEFGKGGGIQAFAIVSFKRRI